MFFTDWEKQRDITKNYNEKEINDKWGKKLYTLTHFLTVINNKNVILFVFGKKEIVSRISCPNFLDLKHEENRHKLVVLTCMHITDKLYQAKINNKLFYSDNEWLTRRNLLYNTYLHIVPLCTINQPLYFFINRERIL